MTVICVSYFTGGSKQSDVQKFYPSTLII